MSFLSVLDEAMNFLVRHILSLPSSAVQPGEHTSLVNSAKTSMEDSYSDRSGEEKKSSSCCSV